MHVGFLALHAPNLSPSQRYRVEAYLPHLQRRGISVEYDWLLDREDLRLFYGRDRAVAKAWIAARAAVERFRQTTVPRAIDLFLVQREAFFLGPAWSERLAQVQAPLVFDFDDAIWIRDVSEGNQRFAWLKNIEKCAAIARRAQVTLAGNEYLAAWARQHSSRVTVVPTCIDTDRYAPEEKAPEKSQLTIGWSGSLSTIPHLRTLLPVLERAKRAFGDRIRIRVMGDASFAHPPAEIVGEAWSPEAEMALLREMDIGVMPLPDTAWTRGKCGLKGLLSMAMGAAAVMSPVGVNTEIVQHGVNGFLPASDQEWFDVLAQLIEDPDLRTSIGHAGRATVVDRYSIRRWEGTVADVLRHAVR
ncbi:MAG: glycosyltransferase family 4 protein [Acidobacteria bacterium]|nr:glycosyltransferase family 4 protein [Acidobacteriota bacterium]